MLEKENNSSSKQQACWNCRLYDDCDIKFYVTDICDKYKDCRIN